MDGADEDDAGVERRGDSDPFGGDWDDDDPFGLCALSDDADDDDAGVDDSDPFDAGQRAGRVAEGCVALAGAASDAAPRRRRRGYFRVSRGVGAIRRRGERRTSHDARGRGGDGGVGGDRGRATGVGGDGAVRRGDGRRRTGGVRGRRDGGDGRDGRSGGSGETRWSDPGGSG